MVDKISDKFELQVRYNTGWQTIDEVEVDAYAAAKRRWRHLKVRLQLNGKTVDIKKIGGTQ